MIPDALHLAVAADTYQAAGALKLGHLRGKFWECVFILAKPFWPALGSLVQDAVRHEMIQLRVVVYFAVFKPVVLAERAAVIYDERRCFRDA